MPAKMHIPARAHHVVSAISLPKQGKPPPSLSVLKHGWEISTNTNKMACGKGTLQGIHKAWAGLI
uniref:Uncharacterized protein n=1 Tax=Anguilla anguilla TaxID=7936 RepID=A0A0E9RUU9_ANGAN